MLDAQPRRSSGGGGPVIEYVRGPMRIAMAPVASANPNDAGVGRRRGGSGGGGGRDRNRRGGSGGRQWDRAAGGERPPRVDRGPRPNGGPGGNLARPPVESGAIVDADGKRRRRRRRRRRGGNGLPMQALPPGNGSPLGPNGPNAGEEPVAFFTSGPSQNGPSQNGPSQNGPQQPVVLGPDGQPLRKRRRRRRRGRGGRQREWRPGMPGGPEGATAEAGADGSGGGDSGGDFGGDGDSDGPIGDE